MKPGDRIKIKDAEGRKWWGLVTQVTKESPGSRSPGPVETTLIIVLEGPR